MRVKGKILVSLAAAGLLSACAANRVGGPPLVARTVDTARLEVFAPRPDGQQTTIDYEPHDMLLSGVVLVTGPSLRKRARPKPLATGTRLRRGHTSPNRLEGNKVLFSRIPEPVRELFYKVTDATVSLANTVDIARLPKDEQLVYWLNLHTLLVVSTILKNYPVTSPGNLMVGEPPLPFHDAPLAVIRGVPLSLRDIRIGIVYRNWKDPRVMYGFFHGDLASPNIRVKAWKADTVWRNLDSNASEFINALRGVRKSGGKMAVSPIYREARDALFPDWPTDLREHLTKYAQEPVAKVLASTGSVRFSRYEDRTADLLGGQLPLVASPIDAFLPGPPGYANQREIYLTEFGQSYGEFVNKFQNLKGEGKKRFETEVTVEDLDEKEDAEKKTDRDRAQEDADGDKRD